MIEAAKNAAHAANRSTDGALLLDSLDVMEAGMRYFFSRFQAERAEEKPRRDKADAALLQAVAIAKDIAPYRHPRLATMKLASDPNANKFNELSREELRARIISKSIELGLIPPMPPAAGENDPPRRLVWCSST